LIAPFLRPFPSSLPIATAGAIATIVTVIVTIHHCRDHQLSGITAITSLSTAAMALSCDPLSTKGAVFA